MNELQVSYDGRSYRFQPGQTARIGRSTGNDVVVSDPTVSRQHAQLTWGPDGWVWEGLSRAGTFAGGTPVTRLVLSGVTDVCLASPQGPVIRLWPQPAAGPGAPDAGAQADAGLSPGTEAGAAGLGMVPGAERSSGAPPAAPADDLATAFQILVPVRSWLSDPGWRQGVRLLVIPYALLPLVFLALFGSSGNLSTPGWAYSLYTAPLWAIAFWLLIRPGPAGKLELLTGAGVIVWVLIWMSLITVGINSHMNPGNFGDALVIGFNEETTKALPILAAALLLARLRSVKLDVRMWLFLGTVAGLTFGVKEASFYTTEAIEHIAAAAVLHSANLAVLGALSFAFRVFVDGFQHAIWAGVSAFFIGMAVNYPRRRVQLILFGVTMAALLHALNDWILSNVTSLWPWIALQAVSLFLFLGYTMSATAIERRVRRTPLFRGDSILMERFTESGDVARP